jgi:hypothetical protein
VKQKLKTSMAQKINGIIDLVAISLLLILIGGCDGTNKGGADNNSTMASDTGTAIIKFNNLEHDFGSITEGEKLAYVFTYTNEGTGNLIINSASTSCGCTVPEFSKKPLAPGQKATMEVIFDSSGYNGFQTKTITVQSNASMPVVILAIRAEVKSKTK